MRRVPKPSSFNRGRADTAPGSSIASLRSPSNCEGGDLSRSSPIKIPRGKLPTAGQFLLSPGGQFFMSPDTGWDIRLGSLAPPTQEVPPRTSGGQDSE